MCFDCTECAVILGSNPATLTGSHQLVQRSPSTSWAMSAVDIPFAYNSFARLRFACPSFTSSSLRWAAFFFSVHTHVFKAQEAPFTHPSAAYL